MIFTSIQPTDTEGLRNLCAQHCKLYGFKIQHQNRYKTGLTKFLAWFNPKPGQSWQELWDLRFEASDNWEKFTSPLNFEARSCLYKILQLLIAYRLVRPSYRWLLNHRLGDIHQVLFNTTERQGGEQFHRAAHELGIQTSAMRDAWRFIARILIHTGKAFNDITTADLSELREITSGKNYVVLGHFVAARLLFHLEIVKDPMLTPSYFKRTHPTMEQVVEKYQIRNQKVRQAFILYLKERAAAMDFTSVHSIAYRLAKLFWRDIEDHHPEVIGFDIPPHVIEAWKQRVRKLPDGRERREHEIVFLTVRAFYLDVLHWAQTNPEVWGSYATKCPIRESDLASHPKSVLQQKARTHARIRMLHPLLPQFLAHLRSRRDFTKRLLETALACPEDGSFEIDKIHYERFKNNASPKNPYRTVDTVIVRRKDQPKSPKIYCQMQEDRAFWAWAITEVLRLTGLRGEELAELTHLSIREHKTPEGQQVLLLQVAPSKQDRERILPICPELAHVLARIVERARGNAPSIPCIPRYDPFERKVGPPLPHLFQGGPKRFKGVYCREFFRSLIFRASSELGLRDKDGKPINFQLHDFRRLFATEAVNSGLPIHIAAKLLGHTDLNTTRGYVAVYEEDVIRHYQNHLAKRRAFRPSHEYREPTESEWTEFAKHFRRRKLGLGDCYRPYGTYCPHEHACVRCPMLRMDPAQQPRLIQIEDDTLRLLKEARRKGWEGEVNGLEATLVHIQGKKAQCEARVVNGKHR